MHPAENHSSLLTLYADCLHGGSIHAKEAFPAGKFIHITLAAPLYGPQEAGNSSDFSTFKHGHELDIALKGKLEATGRRNDRGCEGPLKEDSEH